MAIAIRSLAVKQHPSASSSLVSLLSLRSFTACPLLPSRLPLLVPLVALVEPRKLAPLPLRSSKSVRCFSVNRTSSSLNDPSPNWSNRPPKETILLDGCDFEHWLVVVEPPDPNLTRDEIIKSYIKTLAQVVGSEEEARFKIYSVSTKHYFAFGALVSEELSYKLKEIPGVRWVLPDSYLDVKNKDYGGEPFINGEAVPYDPKYHEEWVRNNARAMERNRRNDRPRTFDRSRNFERRRENMQNFQNKTFPPPMQSQAQGDQWNQGPPNPVPSHMPNQGGMPPPPRPNLDPQNATPSMNMPNMGGGPNYGGYQNPNQMPGPSPVAPPMPPRNAPNPGLPNRDFGGFQNQAPPNYQNRPQGGIQNHNADGGNPYQGGNPYSYQGPPSNFQAGPVGYHGPPNAYQRNPVSHQAPPNPYQNNGGGSNVYQGQDTSGTTH